MIEVLRQLLIGVGIYFAVGAVLTILVSVVVLVFIIKLWGSMR